MLAVRDVWYDWGCCSSQSEIDEPSLPYLLVDGDWHKGVYVERKVETASVDSVGFIVVEIGSYSVICSGPAHAADPAGVDSRPPMVPAWTLVDSKHGNILGSCPRKLIICTWHRSEAQQPIVVGVSARAGQGLMFQLDNGLF